MKNLAEMKDYIKEHGLTGQVKELSTGLDMDTAEAIEYVYDVHTLGKAAFVEKYFN